MRRRQLAQVSPTTTASTAFQLTDAAPFTVDLVNIVNVTDGSVDVSLYHDSDGTTYTSTSSLIWNHTLAAGEILCYEHPISGYTVSEGVGVRCSVDAGATFTFYGIIEGERL